MTAPADLTPACRCTSEAGDSRCDVHPTCEYCGAAMGVTALGVMGFRGAQGARYCTAEHRAEAEGPPKRNTWLEDNDAR